MLICFLFSIQLFLMLQIFFSQVNGILMLNGRNFKILKDNVEIVLSCMKLNLALRMECPTFTPKNLNEANIEKWERSNCLSLMLMKHSIP